MKCLIIIPAYNEAECITQVVENLIKNYPQYDYLVVDDGSKDSTGKICKERGFNVVSLPINMGIGGAVQTGYRYALANDYDVAVQMDGDGQHDPRYLDEMLEIIENKEADLVIGSRFVTKEGFQSSGLRRFGITFLSILGFLLTGKRLKDITSGYRMVNKKFIRIFAEDYPTDYPEPEAMVIAAVYGGSIKEYPVIMSERVSGKSSITGRKTAYYMVKVTLAMLVRRLSYGVRRG